MKCSIILLFELNFCYKIIHKQLSRRSKGLGDQLQGHICLHNITGAMTQPISIGDLSVIHTSL